MNWFDTADSYGTGSLSGRAEELLGKFDSSSSPSSLVDSRKKRVYMCTKLAPYPWRIGSLFILFIETRSVPFYLSFRRSGDEISRQRIFVSSPAPLYRFTSTPLASLSSVAGDYLPFELYRSRCGEEGSSNWSFKLWTEEFRADYEDYESERSQNNHRPSKPLYEVLFFSIHCTDE